MRNTLTKGSVLKTVAALRSSIIPIVLVLSGLLTLGRAATFGDFIYTTNDVSATITGYTGPGGNVIIPDVIEGKPVTVIGKSAFYQSTNLTSVTIPNSVTFLDASAFAFCGSLTNVLIPNRVTNIGEYVFYRCGRLTEVAIPNSVMSLGSSTFEYCYALTNVTLPNGITNIMDSMFFMCTNLAEITLPDSVTSIADYAFYGCADLTNIAIPNSLISIGYSAFKRCAGLTNLSIPATITQIGLFPFSRCANLTAISVDPLNATYASVDGVLFDKSQKTLLKYPEGKAGDYIVPSGVTTINTLSFADCSKLTNVAIPDGIIIIGQSAFSGCTKLAYVNIPDSVTAIQDHAFQECSSLTNIFIPASVTNLVSNAIARCSSLTAINVDPANTNYSSLDGVLFNKSQNTLLQFPGGRSGTYLIPPTVTVVRESAFAGCARLTGFAVPTISNFSALDGVLFNKSQTTLIACPGAKTGYFAITNTVTKLAGYAFSDCGGLTNISIPNNISIISSNAFYQCSGLTSIILPGNVYKLCNSAFLGCVGLTSITIPRSVSSIEDYCFVSCSNLTSVYCEGKAPSLINAYSPFSYANLVTVYYRAGTTGWEKTFGGRPTALWDKTDAVNFSYQQIGSAYTIIDYLGSGGSITIPESINGLPVTSIADYAFSYHYVNAAVTNITSISIPSSVTRIGNYAFSRCTGLTNVTIPGSVTSIGYDAFNGCTALTDVTLQTGVTTIGAELFQGCINLVNISIPDSVTRIGDSTFQGCISLTNVTLPNNLSSIGSAAFSGCKALTGITLPESVRSIGAQCFSNCVVLSDITIPNGVTNIEKRTFDHCESMTNVVIPSSVSSIGMGAFYSCAGLTNITIPGSVTYVGTNAFAWCANLKRAEFLGNSPAFAAPNAFANSSRATVYFHAGTTGWGPSLGGRPTALVDFNFQIIGPTATITGYTGPGGNVIIPDTIQDKKVGVIGSSAFKGCATLEDIKISDNVYNIGSSAFSGCTNLTNVVFGSGISNIMDSAFSGCSGLTSLIIPDTVLYIGASSFSGCAGLTNVVVSSSVARIGDSAFGGCANLPAITVDTLNPYFSSKDGVLFDKNQSMLLQYPAGKRGAYVVPDLVKSIGNSAFDGCANLVSVTVPASVTGVGSGAFAYCPNLRRVYFEGNAPKLPPDSMFLNSTNVTVYYDAGTTGWDTAFAGRPTALWIEPSPITDFTYTTNDVSATITGYTGPGGNVIIPDVIEGKPVVAIGDSAFMFCKILTGIIIPDGVHSIGSSAFFMCTNLTSLAMGSGVTNIMDSAFASCSNLTSIDISSSVMKIGTYAFADCTALTNLTISTGVSSIDEKAFVGCTKLAAIEVDTQNAKYSSNDGILFDKSQSTLIQCPAGRMGGYVIPGTVSAIGISAFDSCWGLTNVTVPSSVTSIGDSAFWRSTRLTGVYFQGNAPAPVPKYMFYLAPNVTVYYRAGTTGWGDTYAGQPTALWIDQPTYQQWAQTVGLLEKFPNASAETDDADHDGMNNLAEMQAGTDPTTADSALKFERTARLADLSDGDKTAIGAGQHALYFQTVAGKKYEIQSVAVFGGVWQTETNVTATTTQKRVVVNKPVGQGFYRVVLVP